MGSSKTGHELGNSWKRGPSKGDDPLFWGIIPFFPKENPLFWWRIPLFLESSKTEHELGNSKFSNLSLCNWICPLVWSWLSAGAPSLSMDMPVQHHVSMDMPVQPQRQGAVLLGHHGYGCPWIWQYSTTFAILFDHVARPTATPTNLWATADILGWRLEIRWPTQ